MNPNNSNLTLKTDNRADCIFKKGDYTHTYVAVKTSGLPSDATLYLLDENLNQLYSPYDTNGNAIKSQCYITNSQTNIIPLPALYNNNEWSDLPADEYNWFLKFYGNDYYETQIIPITVEIRDFDTWVYSSIYPNENLTIRERTYVDTIPIYADGAYHVENYEDIYDDETGILTILNNHIDNTVGQHSVELINEQHTKLINYEVKNPIFFIKTPVTTDYLSSINGDKYEVGIQIYDDCTLTTNNNNVNILINGITRGVNPQKTSKKSVKDVTDLPPGTYNCVCSIVLSNNESYNCSGSFIITTNNCSITLSTNESKQLIATYTYNDTIPIPNATLALINLNNNTTASIQTTDSNGQVVFDTGVMGYYKVVSLDSYTNEILLSSNIVDIGVMSEVSINEDGNLVIHQISRFDLDGKEIYDDAYLSDYELELETVDAKTLDNLDEILTTADVDDTNLYFSQVKDENL